MEDDKEHFLEIDNNSCILVLFTNDNNKALTGYKCWLGKNDLENIETIIEERQEIRLQWPDCDISSVATLKTHLKNATFSEHPGLILAHGDWLAMRNKRRYYIEYGVLSPTKDDRKAIKRKARDDDENKIILTKTSSRSQGKSNTDAAKKAQQSMNEVILSKLSTPKNDSNTTRFNVPDIFKDAEATDNESDDSGSGSKKLEDDNVQLLIQFDSQKKELEEKNVKIRKLTETIAQLQDELKTERQRADELQVEKVTLELDLKDYKDAVKKGKKGDQDIEAVTDGLERIKNLAIKTMNKLKNEPLKDITNGPNESWSGETSGTSSKWRESSYSDHDNDDENDSDNPPKAKRPHKKVAKSGAQGSSKVFHIKSKVLENVSKTSVADYTNDILTALYEDEELATCSVTGEVCPANKSNPETNKARPALEQTRYNAALKQAYVYFGRTKSVKTWFNYTAKNKLGKMKAKFKKNANTGEQSDNLL